MTITRKEFLLGIGGAAVGAPLGFLGHRGLDRARTNDDGDALEAVAHRTSFSQSGEDIVAGFIFDYLGIDDITYLDVGAYEPIQMNNTYYFYLRGHRGVLVEPNVTLAEKLAAVRPEDKTLIAGIGVTSVKEADYYVMSEPSWSTFSKEEAEHQVAVTEGEVFIKEIRKMPLVDVNDVIAQNFDGAPSFVSIDAEGWSRTILEAIDYERFRPNVVCVETLVLGSNETIPEIAAFMESKGYVARGASFVNTLFVDSAIL